MRSTPEPSSPARLLASLSEAERDDWLSNLTEDEARTIAWHWPFWARIDQLSPWSPGRDDRDAALRAFATWVIVAGRGWGKTRCGAETTNEEARLDPNMRAALVGRTAADVRDVMIEGESGILAKSAPDFRPAYEPSKRRLTWPNGAQATAYSADEPSLLRGPQHTFAWADEVAAWPYADAWDQLQFGLRLGAYPRCVVTTTPQPKKVIRDLVSDPRTFVTRGSTYDNAQNLSPDFLEKMRRRYEGTTLGRQELHAEILDEAPGALFTRALVDSMRVSAAPLLERVGVFVDPSVTSGEAADATGILAVGRDAAGILYVLRDASGQMTPGAWARRAVELYWSERAVDMTLEGNQGAELLTMAVANVDGRINARVRHVRGSKAERLQPAVALAEQGRLRIVGALQHLEEEATTWSPDAGWSPGRLDALSLAVSEMAGHYVAIPAPDLGGLDCPSPYEIA